MSKRMWSKQTGLTLLLAVLMAGVLGIVGSTPVAEAQQPSAAVVSGLTGAVQVKAKGETAFQPLRLGMRVLEGADIVAGPGANAELRLPDGSTLTVAENTRIVVSKLDFDAQNRMRSSIFSLAVGKVRAFVAKAASTLVSARQTGMSITTPTAVAAVRGSDGWVTYNPTTQETTFVFTSGTFLLYDAVTGTTRTITVGPGQPPVIITRAAAGGFSEPRSATTAELQTAQTTGNPLTAGNPSVVNPTANGAEVAAASTAQINTALTAAGFTTGTGGGEGPTVLYVAPPPPSPSQAGEAFKSENPPPLSQ